MQSNIQKSVDFSGENIYAGFDVHKKSWKVTIMTDCVTHKTFVQPPSPEILVNYLRENFPGGNYHSAYEAGFCGFWIHNQLKKFGVNSIVVNPADIPTSQKEKVQKEDKRDSIKIARELRKGELKPIYVPSTKSVENRSLVRMRHLLVKDMARYKQRVKSFLYFHGISLPEEFDKKQGYWSKRFINWLKSIELTQSTGKHALAILIRESESLRVSILDITKQIHILSESEPYKQQTELLRTIPGIGLITTMTILTELDDINRFKSNDDLCSYIGLVPMMNDSGEKERHGDLTFRANHILRRMLIESSWIVVRHDPALMKAYHDYCKRMVPNKAIIRIARKLLNRIRYVLKNQQPYEKLKMK